MMAFYTRFLFSLKADDVYSPTLHDSKILIIGTRSSILNAIDIYFSFHGCIQHSLV